MQLFYIVIICFVGLSHGFEEENPLLQALTGSQIARAAACGAPGEFSNAKCLSQTKFIFIDDPDTATLLECEAGTVCVDKPGICLSGVEPLCSNTVPLDPTKPKCSVCETPTTKYTCISQTSYVTCVNGEPLTKYPQKCAANKFCKIDVIAGLIDPCSVATPASSECANAEVAPPATPATPGSGSSGCTTVGLFPTAGDTTCRGYYSCYKDTNGQFVKTSYTCSGTLIFNPTTQRCVSTTAYTCSR